MTTRAASVMRAAEMYYLEQMTMDAIAETIGCSRATVSRMISEARTSGLVEITVHRHRRAAATLERLIAERYNVDVTVVAPPENANDTDRLRHAAAQAATVLRASLAPDLTIAVAWGATISTLARSLSPGVIPGVQIIQMSGAGNTFFSGAEYAAGTLGRFGQRSARAFTTSRCLPSSTQRRRERRSGPRAACSACCGCKSARTLRCSRSARWMPASPATCTGRATSSATTSDNFSTAASSANSPRCSCAPMAPAIPSC